MCQILLTNVLFIGSFNFSHYFPLFRLLLVLCLGFDSGHSILLYFNTEKIVPMTEDNSWENYHSYIHPWQGSASSLNIIKIPLWS